MPTQTFYLDQDSTESIVISHGFNFKNFTISKDGKVLGYIENAKQLKAGDSFQLDSNRVLSIRLNNKFGFMPQLEILLNGNPIPGSATEPYQKVKQAYYVLVFIAVLNVGLGFVAEIGDVDFLKAFGMGYGTVFIGLINGVLAYLVKIKLSVIALYCAMGLILLDVVASVLFAAEMGGNPTSGLFMKAIFLFMLFNAIPALKQLKNQEKAAFNEAV